MKSTIAGAAALFASLSGLAWANAAGGFAGPQADSRPLLGAAVGAAILLCAALRQPSWRLLPGATKGSIFLLSLVLCASMMPVDQLPPASWLTALGLGFLSAGFDNLPLTALAIQQGGCDWGFLACAVGFGGSMIWFGSSAGVALSDPYPQARSIGLWLHRGSPIKGSALAAVPAASAAGR